MLFNDLFSGVDRFVKLFSILSSGQGTIVVLNYFFFSFWWPSIQQTLIVYANFWWRALSGTFLGTYFEFGPVVKEEISFKDISIFSCDGQFVQQYGAL